MTFNLPWKVLDPWEHSLLGIGKLLSAQMDPRHLPIVYPSNALCLDEALLAC